MRYSHVINLDTKFSIIPYLFYIMLYISWGWEVLLMFNLMRRSNLALIRENHGPRRGCALVNTQYMTGGRTQIHTLTKGGIHSWCQEAVKRA